MTATSPGRSVARIADGVRTLEGAGFAVRRLFPTPVLDHVDPFLLLDEMGPADLRPGEAKGAPDHPHRGFETVTYVLHGELEHRDSAGHAGRLGPGDVQWMTAGAGVVHSEMPASVFLRTGGRMHGFQLWVNLPRRDKLMAPRYQEVPAARIPAVRDREGVSVKVIAGEALGARAVIDTRTPILYLHFTLAPGARARQPLPPDWNAFAYVFSGRGLVGREERPVIDGQGAILATDGELISLAAPAGAHAPLELLLVAGLPLCEPVVRYGPFVMNSEEEILQAVEDFRAGRLGRRS
jgi:redox-sensitive bicupin YhaK (pirin superfamily)